MSNEEILLEFSATDSISSVVESIQTNALTSINAIQSAIDTLESSLGNLTDSASAFSQAFGGGEGISVTSDSLDSLDAEAEETSSSLDNMSSAMDSSANSSANAGQGFEETTAQIDSIQKASGKGEDALKGMSNTSKDASSSVDNLSSSIGRNTSQTSGNTSATNQDRSAKQELGGATRDTTGALEENSLAIDNNTNLSTLSAGSAMYLAGQMSSLGSKFEDSAHRINETRISLDQVAKMSGTAQGEFEDMITYMSNETFSNEEAILYTKNLTQMGVESKNFVEQATNMDKINDAFGLGAETTNSLVTELGVLGVDMNDISSSFNALAYANENTKGGMENFYAFLRKYDSQLAELGYDTDQTALIISAATQKFGAGRPALQGLSTALKDAGSDTSALESALNLKAGALQHATQETSTYEGQLQSLADEEMEHKTWLDRINAAWDDFTLKNSAIITTVQSIMGVFGQGANIGLTVFGLKEIGTAIANWSHIPGVLGKTVDRMMRLGKTAQDTSKLVSSVTPADAMMMAGGNKSLPTGNVKAPTTAPVNTKGTKQIANSTKTVINDAKVVGEAGAGAGAVAGEVTATSGIMASISSAFTTMIVPLLAISAVIAVMLPIMAGLVAEALLLIKGIQLLIEALDFDSIDLSGAIDGIKQVGEAIWEVARAMGAMALANVLTIIAVFTGGIMGLINPLGVATTYLMEAGEELRKFGDVQIPSDVASNIRKIADSIKAVTNAFDALIALNLGMIKGNILTLGGLLGNVKDAISTAREEIIYAGQEIANIGDVPNIDDGVVSKLEKIGSSIESMGKAMDGLRSIRDSQNFDVSGWIGNLFGGADIGKALESVKQDVYDASEALKQFDGVATIPDGVSDNLKKVADSLKSVGDSITTLRKLRDDYNWDVGAGSLFGGSDIKTSFDNIKKDLVDVSNSLKSLGGEKGELGDIGKDVPEKIKKVADTLDSVLKAVDKMNEFKGKGEGNQGNDFTKVVETIDNARESLITVSGSLKKLGANSEGQGGLETIGEDVKTKLNSVSKILNTLSKIMSTLKGFPVVSGDEIPNRVQKAVTVISNSARHLNGLKGTKSVDEGVGTLISNVGKYGGKLKTAIEKLKGFPVVSGNEIPNRVQKAVTVISNSARHLNGLKGTKSVNESVGTVITTTGKYGGRLKTAIGKLKGFPVVSGDEIPKRVQKAVTVIKNTARHLNGLKGTKSVNASIGTVITTTGKYGGKLKTTIRKLKSFPVVSGNEIPNRVKKAVTAVKNTAKYLNKLKGTSVKGGVGGILSAVSKAVKQLRTTLKSIAPGFKSNGQSIGSNLKSGIKTGLSGLNGTVSSGISSAVTASTGTATTGGNTLGTSMVNGFKSSFLLSAVISGEMSAGLTAITTATPDLTNAMGALADQMVQEFKNHAGIASPGDIARSIRDEMIYGKDFVTTRGKEVVSSVGNLARNMVNSFNPNLRTNMSGLDNDLNTGRLNTLRNLNNPNNMNQNGNQSAVTFIFNEGAIQLDARDLSKQEARQVILYGLEGLDEIESINIRGG